MPLSDRLDLRPHSRRRFRRAAWARLRAAQALRGASRRLDAVYLAGYAAEVTLKGAYFRAAGWGPDQTIAVADMLAARQKARTVYGVAWAGNLHDLNGWARLLAVERGARGMALPPDLERPLRKYSHFVWLNWNEAIRYHDAVPYRGEVEGVFVAVQWLVDRAREL